MMKEITELRRQGKLQEAYRMAENFQKMQPGKWADTAMFWVLRDMADDYYESGNLEQAHDCLKRMERLQPEMMDDHGAGRASILKLKRLVEPQYDAVKQCSELSKTEPVKAYDKIIAMTGKRAENLDESLHEDFGWILYRYLKSRLDELSSVEVRTLLRDYMMLKNNRPSMLHSMMLNFALNFAKDHPDFIFQNFLEMWEISNLRDEDLKDGSYDGRTIPSLISRICWQLASAGVQMVDEISQETGLAISDVADMYRRQWFWILFELKDSDHIDEFWGKTAAYIGMMRAYPPTEWHSKIMKLAVSVADTAHIQPFMELVLCCKSIGLRDEDWLEEKGKDGNTYPPMAVQLARKCYELVENKLELHEDPNLCEFLIRLYDEMEKRGAGDEWTARQRADISLWMGDRQDALRRYRELLKVLGDRFFIWQELAQCVEDRELQAGLLLHALELERSEDIIGPLRLQTAEVLLDLGYADDAGKLLDAYEKNRKRQGKSCPNSWSTLKERVRGEENRRCLDLKQTVLNALDYVYSEYPEQAFVLVWRYTQDKNKTKAVFSNGMISFAVSAKRAGIRKNDGLGAVVNVRYADDNTGTLIPLVFRLTDAPKWSALPESFGVVYYVNDQKSAVSILTSRLENTFFIDKEKSFKAGDFVTFRYYVEKRDGWSMLRIVNPEACAKRDAIRHFPSERCEVIVTEVSQQDFRFKNVTGLHHVRGAVKLCDTELRPGKGDKLMLTYCSRRDQRGMIKTVVLDLGPSDS